MPDNLHSLIAQMNTSEVLKLGGEGVGAALLIAAAALALFYKRYEVVVGILILFGASAWHGKQVDRWGHTDFSEKDLVEKMASIPLKLEGWDGEDVEVGDDVLDMAGAVAHVNRIYTSLQTGRKVKVWLIVGHTREICQHTPNICYPSQGFIQDAEPIHFSLPYPGMGDLESDFFTTTFMKESDEGIGRERVFWAWSEDGNWITPSIYPREYFRNQKALFKLYFATVPKPEETSPEQDICVELAKLMIPEVNKALADRFNEQRALDLHSKGTSQTNPPAKDEKKEAK